MLRRSPAQVLADQPDGLAGDLDELRVGEAVADARELMPGHIDTFRGEVVGKGVHLVAEGVVLARSGQARCSDA